MDKTISFLKTLLIVFAIAIISSPALASEKPEIFMQMAKESIIYFSGLKFIQEVQT